jgi:hypothetical protein
MAIIMGVDGSDPASLVIRQHKVADGEGHLSEHYDISLHGEQVIQRPRKQSPTDHVTPENLDDDSQEYSTASDADDLVN